MKKLISRIAGCMLGILLGVSAWAGLETVTHISDLNSAWPLGSDLASTSDDHIRNIKVALKTDFPNINAAVTATPTQLNQLTGLSTVQGDILYASGTNTLTNLAKNTSSTRYLSNTGTSNNPAWAQVSLTTGVTGNLPSTNLDLSMSPTWTGTHNFSGTGITTNFAGKVTMGTPSSGTTLAVAGLGTGALVFGETITMPNNSGTSSGLRIFAGTNSSDHAFNVTNAAATTSYFEVRGDGAVLGGGPVAGALVDLTPDTSTFTATMTGGTTSPTCTARWTRVGNVVFLEICSATATSNSTSFTYTGLPSAIQPTVTQHIPAASSSYEDNGSVQTATVEVVVTASSGTITFWHNGASTGWTNANAKGVLSINTVSYLLN